MTENSNLKLLGKLGLNLSQLEKDIKTLDSLITRANISSKKLGSAWKNVADEMEKAFKGFPLNKFAKALESYEKIQRNGLASQARALERHRNSEKRKDEKHQNTLILRQMKTNAEIEGIKRRSNKRTQLDEQRFLNAELRRLGKHTNSILQLYAKTQNPFTRKMGSLMDYALASGAIYGSSRAIREVTNVNREFEKEQVNLQRILKATADKMQEVKVITFDIAKDTGNATKDIQEIENLWIRTGRNNLDELKTLTEITAVGLNTAQFKDAGESVSFLNGAINQMADGDWTKAQAILDSWAKTADNTAVKATEDLAEVMSRAGSQARQLGMDFHDVNAVTAILAERMAIDGKKIGTAMKTVFARMSDPSKYEVLQAYGVDVFKEGTKEMKNFVDIMDELTKKYEEFQATGNDDAINKMLKALGGSRRRDIITNLIEGWDRYSEIVEISMNSSGYAMEQNQKIMDTFDKQVEILKVSLAELSLTIGENGLMDFLKGLVEGTQSSINTFNQLDPTIQRLAIALAEVTIAYGALNMTVKKFTKIGIVEAIKNIITLKTANIDWAKSINYVDKLVKAGTITEIQATNIKKSLGSATKLATLRDNELTIARKAQTMATIEATAATTALTTAINVALVGIPILITAVTALSMAKKQATENNLEFIKTQKDEVKETERLTKEYEELKTKTDLTTSEKEKLQSVEERLVELLPKSIEAIYDQNRAFEDQISIVKRLSTEKKNALLEQANLYINANKSEYDHALKKLDEYKLKKQNAVKDLSYTYYSKGLEYSVVPTDEQVAERILKLDEKYKKYKDLKFEYEKNEKLINEIKGSLVNSSDSIPKDHIENPIKTISPTPFDPDEFKYILDELRHEYNMQRLSKEEYAKKLQSTLAENEKNLSQDEIWGLEEQIFNLLKPTSINISKANLAKPLTENINTIDYSEFKKAIDTLEYELSLLRQEEQWLELIGKEKSSILPILTRKIQKYTESQRELNSINQEYEILIRNIDEQIANLDPSTLDYAQTLKRLTDNKRKLNKEIQNNTLSLYKNRMEIDKTIIQIQSYIEDYLKKAYDLEKNLDFEYLDKKLEKKQKELELLDEEISRQEQLNRLTDLQSELAKVKSDTRFSYIDEANGKEIYTYDREKVKNLEEEIDKERLIQAKEAKKKKIQNDIDELEEERKIRETYWNKRISSERIRQDTLRLIESKGYENALGIAENYFNNMQSKYTENESLAYEAGKSITGSLADGLFENLKSIIDNYNRSLSNIGLSSNSKTSNWTDKQSKAHKSANSARIKLTNWGYSKGASDISSHNYRGAKDWYDKYIDNGRKDLSESVKSEFKKIVDAKKKWEYGLDSYHTGGLVGNVAVKPKHEILAKMLTGELVLTPKHLDTLSVTLPTLTSADFSPTTSTVTNNQNKTVIYIDNINADNFDEFMRSISPYIVSHK